jgi:hypothetical protein
MLACSRLSTIVCTVAFAACAGCGSGGGPSGMAIPSASPTPIVAGLALPPAGTIYLGAFVNPSGLEHGTSSATVAAFESQIGRKLAIDLGYQAFTSKFGTRLQADDITNDRIPIYSWNCGPSNAAIASGAYDASIVTQATAIKAYSWPVFVRYMWDPDLPSATFNRSSCYDPLTDNPDHTFSPIEFVAAWQHIRNVFAQTGAVNAIFLWTISSVGKDSVAYYPGDAAVDWVGLDSYDLSGTSFAATFGPTYASLTAFNKPTMISEAGAPGSIQTSFFSGAQLTLQSQFPLVRAFVYYDAIGSQADWRLTTAALPAFAAFAASSYLSGHYVKP